MEPILGSVMRRDWMMLRRDCSLRAILNTRARRNERSTVMPLTLTVISTKLTMTMNASKQLNASPKYLGRGGGGGGGVGGGDGGSGSARGHRCGVVARVEWVR